MVIVPYLFPIQHNRILHHIARQMSEQTSASGCPGGQGAALWGPELHACCEHEGLHNISHS